MSNQIGDRYSCSDPNCGCEIEIQRPCNMVPSDPASEVADTAPSRKDFRSEGVSTTGDFGDQGSKGEGTFGTVGSGDRSATTSGRYDTEGTRVRETAHSSGRALTCFCGSAMTEIGTGRQRAQAARFGSDKWRN